MLCGSLCAGSGAGTVSRKVSSPFTLIAGSRTASPSGRVSAPDLVSTLRRSRDSVGTRSASARSSRQPTWLEASAISKDVCPPAMTDNVGEAARGFQWRVLHATRCARISCRHERHRSCQPVVQPLVPRPVVAGRRAQQRHRAARRRAGPRHARALPRTADRERARQRQQVEVLPPGVRCRGRLRRRDRHARGEKRARRALRRRESASNWAGWSPATACPRARSSCCSTWR